MPPSVLTSLRIEYEAWYYTRVLLHTIRVLLHTNRIFQMLWMLQRSLTNLGCIPLGSAIGISKALVQFLPRACTRDWIGSPTTLQTRLEEIWWTGFLEFCRTMLSYFIFVRDSLKKWRSNCAVKLTFDYLHLFNFFYGFDCLNLLWMN